MLIRRGWFRSYVCKPHFHWSFLRANVARESQEKSTRARFPIILWGAWCVDAINGTNIIRTSSRSSCAILRSFEIVQPRQLLFFLPIQWFLTIQKFSFRKILYAQLRVFQYGWKVSRFYYIFDNCNNCKNKKYRFHLIIIWIEFFIIENKTVSSRQNFLRVHLKKSFSIFNDRRKR